MSEEVENSHVSVKLVWSNSDKWEIDHDLTANKSFSLPRLIHEGDPNFFKGTYLNLLTSGRGLGDNHKGDDQYNKKGAVHVQRDDILLFFDRSSFQKSATVVLYRHFVHPLRVPSFICSPVGSISNSEVMLVIISQFILWSMFCQRKSSRES